MELQGRVDELKRRGLGVVAVSYDPVETLAAFAAQRGIGFPMLSDTGSEIIKRYGLLNETSKPGTRAYGIPHPGIFVLNPRGEVVARFFEEQYQDRFTIANILGHAARFPPSEEYYFEPLKERVPVFQKPFRIAQDVTINASREAQEALKGQTELRLTGTLEYQACDDKICFKPESVPVAWTMKLKPLSR